MSLAKYPAYKDSGVEWLGEVPAHWKVERIKRRCEVFPSNVDKKMHDGEKPVLLCNYTDVYYNDRIVAGLDFMAASATDEQIDRFTLQRGDTIITKDSETADDIGISAFVPDDLPGVVCGYHLTMIRPSVGVDGAFVKRLFDAHSTKAHLEVSANGLTRVGLGQYALDNLTFAWPPQDEQSNIATFLDHETAKIDALVAEQEKLIALLQEKRQAVISHAVTKGLNPNVPMKDSGVEWLGEVPEHWAVGKCGFYLRILSGFAFPSSGFTDDDSDHRLLRGANVGVSRLKWDDTVYWQRSEGDGLDDYEMVEGDLVIGMDRPLIGEGMRVAKVTAEDLPSLLLQRVASLKVGSKLHADYLHYLLASEMFIAHFSPETTGVSVPHISPDQINKFIIPIPPMSEQLAIVNDVKRLLTEFGGLIAESEIAITLLQERRSALISAAVTGQIDVRNWSVSESA